MDANISITDLPALLTHLFEKVQHPLLTGTQGPCRFFVRYLRRKPGRNLVVIYALAEMHASQRSNYPNRSITLTLDEHVLAGASIRFSIAQARAAQVELQQSGVLLARDIGLSIQVFPVDVGLPTLVTCCNTTSQSPVFEVLQTAAQVQLCDPAWCLISAGAEPVHYKPASRCVIAYHLQLEHRQGNGEASQRTLTLFGKVYTDLEQARNIQLSQQQLYEEQKEKGEIPLLPRPLGMVDAPGLVLTEAVQVGNENKQHVHERWGVLRTGTHALQPQFERGCGGAITRVIIPDEELRLTAQVLARLHNSSVHLGKDIPRTGASEAKRVRERASLLAGQNPGLAEELQRLAQQLASRLETLRPGAYFPAHGGFKPSQLLFHSQHVFVVDFDGFCLADPALDVGCFLAYLHPGRLWYQRPGMRQWFEAAAEVFRNTYHQVMLDQDVAHTAIEGILNRSRLYEAAFLLKIATRRVSRLNSARPQELSAMLNEIATNLT